VTAADWPAGRAGGAGFSLQRGSH